MHQILPRLTFLIILQTAFVRCQNEKDRKSEDILRQIEFNRDLVYSAFHKHEPASNFTYDVFQKNVPDSEFAYKAFAKNHPEFDSLEQDRTNNILYGSNSYRIQYFRSKRSSVERSLESIRKQLNEESKKEKEDQVMAAEAFPRLEANDSTSGVPKHLPSHFEYGKFKYFNIICDNSHRVNIFFDISTRCRDHFNRTLLKR